MTSTRSTTRNTTRWAGIALGGVAVGALAVAAVGAFGGGPEDGSARTPAQVVTNPDAPIRTITVTGVGTASATPDAATISLGVEVSAAESGAALDQANAKAQVLLDVLAEFGVEEKDVQTSNLSIYPRYDDMGRAITGYTASNQLSVTLRDLDRAGQVLDAAAALVGNEIRFNGISFFVDDTTAVESDARTDAIEDARRSADDYAAAAGVEVGAVVTISETSISSPTPWLDYTRDNAAGAESAVPIAPGEVDQQVTVTVVYEIG